MVVNVRTEWTDNTGCKFVGKTRQKSVDVSYGIIGREIFNAPVGFPDSTISDRRRQKDNRSMHDRRTMITRFQLQTAVITRSFAHPPPTLLSADPCLRLSDNRAKISYAVFTVLGFQP